MLRDEERAVPEQRGLHLAALAHDFAPAQCGHRAGLEVLAHDDVGVRNRSQRQFDAGRRLRARRAIDAKGFCVKNADVFPPEAASRRIGGRMPARSSTTRKLFLGISTLAGAAALAAAFIWLPAGRAEAQNIMAAPACQCSSATAIPELSAKVVHCLCGGMACVVSEHRAGSNLMQCVR